MRGIMAPWATMVNPYFYGGWMRGMSNPWIGQMTRRAWLDNMMRAWDPRRMFGAPSVFKGGVPPHLPLVRIPGFPTQPAQPRRSNTVTEGVSLDAKRSFYQSMMMMSPVSMRDMVGIMVEKMPVADDVSFDDAIEAMKLRANEVNFKLVADSPLSKQVTAMTGDKNTPRVEILQFCDALVARKIMDYVPEFVAFLPCRVALTEDANGKLWVMTLDWNVNWLDYAQNPNSILDAGLRKEAKRIRDALRYIMEGAASGDF